MAAKIKVGLMLGLKLIEATTYDELYKNCKETKWLSANGNLLFKSITFYSLI